MYNKSNYIRTARGYNFRGWYTDAACTNEITEIDGMVIKTLNTILGAAR